MDANAKMGKEFIKKDPHEMSANGKLLNGVIERQGLRVVNGSDKCKGNITRFRRTINGEEKKLN